MRRDAHATKAGAALTVEEIREVARETARSGGRVTARGFGSYAGPLPGGVRVIDTRALDRVVEYDPADMTVTVEAGCRFDVLAATLAEQRQWLPIDVPWPERTTVGGMIAAGLFGPLRATFGTLRDQIIGLRWIGGDGAVLASGGKVVKNVAGYDLMKLHVGARGRFGVITEATFKVRPKPEREIAIVGDFDDPGEAVVRGLAVPDLAEPGWCVVSRAGRSASWRLSVGVLGSEAQVLAASERLRVGWEEAKVEDGPQARAAITHATAGDTASRTSVNPTEIRELISSLDSNDEVDTITADVVSGIVTSCGDVSRSVTQATPARDGCLGIIDQVARAIDPAGLFDVEAPDPVQER